MVLVIKCTGPRTNGHEHAHGTPGEAMWWTGVEQIESNLLRCHSACNSCQDDTGAIAISVRAQGDGRNGESRSLNTIDQIEKVS